MRKIFLAGIAVAALMGTGSASAADMAPVYKAAPVVAPLPANWTGFYFGGHVGGGWGSKELSFFEGKSINTNFVLANTPVNGFLGGVQGGYNFQTGWVVFGIDGDFSWSDINGTNFSAEFGNFSSKTSWLATVTGRIGGTVDHALLYVKAGAAWAHDKYALDFGEATGSETRTGYVVGGGIEYAFTRNWSGKLEYNFMDFGTKNVKFCEEEECETFRVKQRIHAVKVGLNYRFDWVR